MKHKCSKTVESVQGTGEPTPHDFLSQGARVTLLGCLSFKASELVNGVRSQGKLK